ncbi:replication stress response regulator SDE2 [Drosophila obscura]|uniref:replication stress response regulator SDE2 n=1 Tax=Drosophila obscura TaxID=7282 RepID=UPI001BB12CA1|nr:replication stress response regulator SDE2 [Drosophila obscura]XP_041447657.1 replication stress response regulator SDE2 [Drosophila obscura]
MVINILLNNKQLIVLDNEINYNDICTKIEESTHLQRDDYYLVSNGKRLTGDSTTQHESIHCILRQVGGKGGFGSMLRAIGAQIEKTTNREACRDLSGRRLRDINEEKRVRAWLGKQAEREREREERKKRKIEKLLAVPKHDFKDEKYEEARANLTDKVSDAFEEGLKQAEEVKEKQAAATELPSVSGVKRKAPVDDKTKAKKNKKGALWIGDDISGTDSDDSEEEQSETNKKKAIKS